MFRTIVAAFLILYQTSASINTAEKFYEPKNVSLKHDNNNHRHLLYSHTQCEAFGGIQYCCSKNGRLVCYFGDKCTWRNHGLHTELCCRGTVCITTFTKYQDVEKYVASLPVSSSPTPTPSVVPTLAPTPAPIPAPTPSVVPTLTPTPVPTPTKTPEQSIIPTLTPAPVPTPNYTPEQSIVPTSTPAPVPTPTKTPEQSIVPTLTPAPVPTPNYTPEQSKVPTSTPTPVPTPTETPEQSIVPTLTPAPVPTPNYTPEQSEVPTSTPTPVPTPTESPEQSIIPTLTPKPTPTPVETLTPSPTLTKSPSPSVVPTPTSSIPTPISTQEQIEHPSVDPTSTQIPISYPNPTPCVVSTPSPISSTTQSLTKLPPVPESSMQNPNSISTEPVSISTNSSKSDKNLPLKSTSGPTESTLFHPERSEESPEQRYPPMDIQEPSNNPTPKTTKDKDFLIPVPSTTIQLSKQDSNVQTSPKAIERDSSTTYTPDPEPIHVPTSDDPSVANNSAHFTKEDTSSETYLKSYSNEEITENSVSPSKYSPRISAASTSVQNITHEKDSNQQAYARQSDENLSLQPQSGNKVTDYDQDQGRDSKNAASEHSWNARENNVMELPQTAQNSRSDQYSSASTTGTPPVKTGKAESDLPKTSAPSLFNQSSGEKNKHETIQQMPVSSIYHSEATKEAKSSTENKGNYDHIEERNSIKQSKEEPIAKYPSTGSPQGIISDYNKRSKIGRNNKPSSNLKC